MRNLKRFTVKVWNTLVSQLSEYLVMHIENACKAAAVRLCHFTKFLFPVILLNTDKEVLINEGTAQRDAATESKRC